jgi:hypothetical protein
VTGGDQDTFDRAFAEAGEFGLQAVFAWIEVGEAIAAILAGDAANRYPGCEIADDYHGLREWNAVPVGQFAVESTGVCRFGRFRLSADCSQNCESRAEEWNHC